MINQSKGVSFIVIILLIAAIFAFSYHTKKEKECFENAKFLDSCI